MDSCSKEGAARLAATIKDYWAKRGHIISTWVEDGGEDFSKRPIFGVRSTLVGGLPQ